MLDNISIQRIQELGDPGNDVLARMYVISEQPKVLDTPPKKLTLTKLKSAEVFGVKNEFIALYNRNYNEVNSEMYVFSLPQGDRTMDKAVHTVLKTLIYLGVNYNKEISDVCLTLFKQICFRQVSHISTTELYKIVLENKTQDYYLKQILDAISCCVFSEQELALHWRVVSYACGCYGKAILAGEQYVTSKFQTSKEMDVALNESYKEAKKDKVFMSRLLKGIPPKPLIGYLWLVKDTHPEYLDTY